MAGLLGIDDSWEGSTFQKIAIDYTREWLILHKTTDQQHKRGDHSQDNRMLLSCVLLGTFLKYLTAPVNSLCNFNKMHTSHAIW